MQVAASLLRRRFSLLHAQVMNADSSAVSFDIGLFTLTQRIRPQLYFSVAFTDTLNSRLSVIKLG